MPIHYLWTDDWRDEVAGIVAEREAKAKREAQEARKRSQQEQRARDLATLAKLKAKYEED